MKELIKHLVNNHLDRIVEKSFLNCHVMGLHSVMLLESPEQTIRLFVSDGNSKLKKNTEENILRGKQTLAFHPHHCNITLHVVKGILTNHLVRHVGIDDPIYNSRNLSNKGCFFANKYIYESAIRASENSVPKFKFSSQQLLQLIDTKNVYEGESLFLNASDIHTVTTYGPLTTAWFVYEGKEDVNYIPFCYNVSEISEQTNHKLYKKPNEDQVKSLLRLAGVL